MIILKDIVITSNQITQLFNIKISEYSIIFMNIDKMSALMSEVQRRSQYTTPGTIRLHELWGEMGVEYCNLATMSRDVLQIVELCFGKDSMEYKSLCNYDATNTDNPPSCLFGMVNDMLSQLLDRFFDICFNHDKVDVIKYGNRRINRVDLFHCCGDYAHHRSYVNREHYLNSGDKRCLKDDDRKYLQEFAKKINTFSQKVEAVLRFNEFEMLRRYLEILHHKVDMFEMRDMVIDKIEQIS